MASLVVSLALAAGVAATPLSPDAQALIAPVFKAIAEERAELARLPPPRTDAERLIRAFKLQQAGRVIVFVDFSKLPADQRAAAREAADAAIRETDHEAQAELKRLLPAQGWFRKSVYGEEAARGAFMIVQHAGGDARLQEDALARMTPLVGTPELDGGQYALLYDRVAVMHRHQPQRYGSQITCVDGRTQPEPIEDPAHVDERRKQIGLKTTLAEYLKEFRPTCTD